MAQSPPQPTLLDARMPAVRWLVEACGVYLARISGRSDAATSLAFDASLDSAHLASLVPALQLGPMLHSLASQGAIEGDVPESVRHDWDAAYSMTVLRNGRRLRALSHIVDRCEKVGVGVLALKGPVHIARIYGDLGMRPMLDVDVQCRERDLAAAVSCLYDLGYESLGETAIHHLEFEHDTFQGHLELHFEMYDLIRAPSAFEERLWETRVALGAAGETFEGPSVACGLVFDVAHLVHHDLRVHLRALVDVAAQMPNLRESDAHDEVVGLLDETDLRSEYEDLETLFGHVFGWMPDRSGQIPNERRRATIDNAKALAAQLKRHWAALPEDTGAGVLRELSYRTGTRRKAAHLGRILFPRGAHLKALHADQPSLLRRVLHGAGVVSKGLRALGSGASLSTVPRVSLKRAMYRRRRDQRN